MVLDRIKRGYFTDIPLITSKRCLQLRVLDSCDIASGGSNDIDLNGVPGCVTVGFRVARNP